LTTGLRHGTPSLLLRTLRHLVLLLLVACLVPTQVAFAQAIAPGDYLPLGADPEWLLELVQGSGPSKLRIDVIDVNEVDTGTRYVLEVPIQDITNKLRLEITNEGQLLLRSLTVDLTKVVEDLPFDPEAAAELQLDPPALLGEAQLVPGSASTTTPVDTQIHAELDTSIGDVDVDVNVIGSLTATWNSTVPVDTAAGIFSDVVMLSLTFDLRFVENDFDSDVTFDETIDLVLARSVGFVQVGTNYRLLRAVVGGQTYGDFAQYEDIVGLHFTVPPLLMLDARADGEAVSGDFALHDIRLSHTLYGKAFLDAILDHPAVTGVAIHLEGKGKARADGTLNVAMDGKTFVFDQKINLKVEQLVDASSTTLDLQLKLGKTKATIPIAIHPVAAGTVDVTIDGFVDQSTGTSKTRQLESEGVLRLGDLAYPLACSEKLELKNSGQRKRTYRFRQSGNDKVILKATATSTSSADFTFKTFKPTFFRLAIPKSEVTEFATDVVEPSSPAGAMLGHWTR
jgi:hypothetical protein